MVGNLFSNVSEILKTTEIEIWNKKKIKSNKALA